MTDFRRERPSWNRPESADDDMPHADPVVIASDQVIDAMNAMERPASAYLHWPFPDLDAVAGGMAPGNVWFVCGASGGGKTTFISSLIDLWRLAGKKVYVMPLETRAHEFRTYLACMATGIHPGDALSGRLANKPAERDMLMAEFRGQLHSPYVEQVMVSGQRSINLEGLGQGLREAKAFGADVVIVDHIDHIQAGDGKNVFQESKLVNDAALALAQENDVILLFTSQLNMSASKGDYLAKYRPPKDEHVNFGELKRRNATGMIGLYRPIRQPRPTESKDEYVKVMQAARDGTGNAMDALEPNTMGVVAMKLRYYGAFEGSKIQLAVRHGRVYPMSEADHWSTAGHYPRKVV